MTPERDRPRGNISGSDRVAVGYIRSVKGIKGFVKLEVLTHRQSRFDELSDVAIEKAGAANRMVAIEAWKPDPPGVLMKFSGVDSPEDARANIVGGYVTIPPDQVAPLPADEYYVSDLIGCSIVEVDGSNLGKVTDVLQMPTTDVYVVRNQTKEFLIPAVGHFIVEVSIPQRQIVVRGVEDLLAKI
jgi:16S rRNA processing protein RimM